MVLTESRGQHPTHHSLNSLSKPCLNSTLKFKKTKHPKHCPTRTWKQYLVGFGKSFRLLTLFTRFIEQLLVESICRSPTKPRHKRGLLLLSAGVRKLQTRLRLGSELFTRVSPDLACIPTKTMHLGSPERLRSCRSRGKTTQHNSHTYQLQDHDFF